MIEFFLAQTPIPKNIPLPLPLPEWLLVGVLVFSFLVHILFVNLMVGGTLLTFLSQLKGLKEPDYDTLAHEIAKTITVNKSMAVVMGVAPLLAINTLYTVYFYSANALTGLFWISIIPLVTVAFLLTYPHKYLWDKLKDNKGLHISMIGVAAGIFLFIPLIFLTNINLMLYPEKWGSVQGFASALFLQNVFPRYFHFIFASLAATGLFLFYYFGRKEFRFEEKFTTLDRYEVRKRMYSLAFMATLLQFVAGPLVLLTLPSKAISWSLILVIGFGASLGLISLVWMWKGLTGPKEEIGKDFLKVTVTLGFVVVLMGSGRHIVRANALNPHIAMVAEKTAEYEKLVKEAQKADSSSKGSKGSDPQNDAVHGEEVFNQNCAACHQRNVKLVGPPVLEMVKIYRNDPNGLKAWIRNPGKKRDGYPQMPGFAQLPDKDLESLSKYILSQK